MNTPFRFSDKVVVVTGAAQGIGEGVAMAVAAEGGAVVAIDRSEQVFELQRGIEASGGEVRAHVADLEHYDGAQSAIDFALEAFGRIDVLINNVGGTIWARPYE